MVVPAESDAVARVRRAAVRPLAHVVQLAPTRARVAAGDHALPVAEHDRAPLDRGEDAGGGADRDDLPALVEQHPLNPARACRVAGDGEGHVVAASLDERATASGRVVLGGDGHDQGGRRPAELGHSTGRGRRVKDHREVVVVLLRRGADVDRGGKTVDRLVLVTLGGAEMDTTGGQSRRALGSGVVQRVEQALQLPGDFRQQPAGDVVSAPIELPDPQGTIALRLVVVGFGPVGIEAQHQGAGVVGEFVGRGGGAGVPMHVGQIGAAGRGGEQPVHGLPLLVCDPGGGALHGPDRGEQPWHRHDSLAQRFGHRRVPGRGEVAAGEDDFAMSGPCGAHEPAGGADVDPQCPAEQFGRVVTADRCGDALVGRPQVADGDLPGQSRENGVESAADAAADLQR